MPIEVILNPLPVELPVKTSQGRKDLAGSGKMIFNFINVVYYIYAEGVKIPNTGEKEGVKNEKQWKMHE